MSQTQLYWAAVILAAVLIGWMMVRLVRSHMALRAHQKACERPGYAPRETFTGTLRHLSGLPVPVGLRLGAAANRGWGVVFAKERFRYAVPWQEIAEIRLLDPQEIPGRRLSCWPQRLVSVRLQQGEPLIFSVAWPGRFATRLQQTFVSGGSLPVKPGPG